MNTRTIIQTTESKYPENEKAFFTSLALSLLEQAQIFSLLEVSEELKKKLKTLLETEAKTFSSHPNLFGKKEIKESVYRGRLDRLSYIQRNILSCPENDEHVLLLTSLKSLEELGEDIEYKAVLKEILLKNLHKIENIHHHEAFIGRQKEIDEINRVLGRSFRNNVLLIGATGVGKTTLAEEIKLHSNHAKIYQLFPGNALFFDQIVSIISSAEGKQVLLLMDELFTFDAAQIKYAIDNCQVIGTANDTAFKKFATENPGIISRFEIVRIEEPEMAEVKKILQYHQKRLSQSHHVMWEDKFGEELITLAKQYLTEQFFPAKGISLLEEATFFAKAQGLSTVTIEMIRSIISQKTNIPIGSLTEFDKKDLSLLPDKLKTKVKGQDEAVSRVSRVIQRSKLGFGKKNKPIGSFMFVGPSGVGKTELAKALAKEIFGDEDAMVRIDMSEFAEAHTVQRLIGAPPGYIGFEEGGQLTNPIKTKPYNLVLLDEIEKAHPRIFDIFLQVLDDGRLTDGQGKVVDFKNTVIIATSNAGIEDILDLIAEGKSQEEIEKELKEILTDYFRIEFINRFDDIIIFNALTPEALEGIGKLQIAKLKQELQKRNIEFSVSDATIKYLANEGCDPRYGARGLLRLLQEKIENKLAEMIINGELQEGQRIEF